MSTEYSGHDIIQRADYFLWDLEKLQKSLEEDEHDFLNLEILHDIIISFCESDMFQKLSNAEKLEKALREIYRIFHRTDWENEICFEIAPEMLLVSEFITLCTFIHTSKRINGKSITEFIKENSPWKFSDPDSPYYRDASFLNSEVERLKRSRMRLLEQGRVYLKKQQWHAITKDEVYEWKFYYELEKTPDEVRDVFKRQKNLYADIRKALKSKRDEGYSDRVQAAYKKFRSKLNKLQYEHYLELQRLVLSRICADKEYYGLNLYRLERRMRPHGIIREVKKLEECITKVDEITALLKTVFLDDICFPAIYEKLFALPLGKTILFAEILSEYIPCFAVESCLILDELVECGVFGNSWKELFRDMSNELAKTVLYDPAAIDFSVTEVSQEKYRRLLNAGVFVEVCAGSNRKFVIDELLI